MRYSALIWIDDSFITCKDCIISAVMHDARIFFTIKKRHRVDCCSMKTARQYSRNDRSFTSCLCAKMMYMSTTYALQAKPHRGKNRRYAHRESGECEDGIGLCHREYGEYAAGALPALCIKDWLLRRLKVTSMKC